MKSFLSAKTANLSAFYPLCFLIVLLASLPSQVKAQCNPTSDSLALVALYNSTDGPNWTNKTNWLVPGQKIETWHGITVDALGCVIDIDLSFNGLNGFIPNELGNLGSLLALNLNTNQLASVIPPQLGNMGQLTFLSLYANQLTGSIPSTLGNLSELDILYLFENQLTGNIPATLGNLNKLTQLHLNSNSLTGSIPPALGGLNNLIGLGLSSNQLTGNIPATLGNLTNLNDLNLSGNQLSGSIPPEFGNLSNLTFLSIDNNQLSGSIPPELGNLAELTFLSLFTNQLSGNIPVELTNLSKLEILWLDNNQLTGNIPPQLGNLNKLREFWVPGNQLTGNIPPELGNLTNLTYLILGVNQLSGNIPVELGNLVNLTNLDLGYNQLTGNIPTVLGNLGNLISLALGGNQLTGNLPPELGNLGNLQVLYLNDNQLMGALPPELGNLTNLTEIHLYTNQFSGCFPDELSTLCNASYTDFGNNPMLPWQGDFSKFCNGEPQIGAPCKANGIEGEIKPDCSCVKIVCPTLTTDSLALVALYNSTDGPNWTNNTNWLAPGISLGDWYGVTTNDIGCVTRVLLGNNGLKGNLPSDLGNLTNLNSLLLNRNQLEGNIPPALGNLAKLYILRLERNQLSGSIPSELGNLNQMGYLDLQINQLSGSIPPELGNLQQMYWLDLSNNLLTGNIPPEIGNMANLNILLFENNQLSGSIPPELGSLSNLFLLSIYLNELTGTIPPELGNLQNMQILWIGPNQLTGTIPPEIQNLSNLIDLYLSGNQLTGNIPSWLGNMESLQYLWLDDNQFAGNIPPELGNLSNLIQLYISRNQLTGTIPAELGNLKKLERLIAGFNQLTGTIPTWLGGLDSLEWLYLNRLQLTGTIPQELGNLKKMVGLNLRGNQLTGSIPQVLGGLDSLEYLYLFGNQLEGNIPAELGNLTKLKALYLNNNLLSGDIPASLGNLVNLDSILLDTNLLSGCFPVELMNLCNVAKKEFGNNPSLPWSGDFDRFCSGEPQIGAVCEDGNPATFGETIQPDCSCALICPTVAITPTGATCEQSNGNVSLNISGGSGAETFLWSNGATTQNLQNVPAGSYSVTVSGFGSCVVTASTTISTTTVPVLDAVPTNAACEQSNGAVILNIIGGNGAETFLWNNNATTQNLQNVPAGNYAVTVTGSNGCTASASATVTGTSQVMAAATPTGATCGQANGSISLNITGGTGTESFLWSNGATTQNLQNVPAGNYSVTATSSNGCVATASATVTGTMPPAVAATPIGATCEQANGTVALGIVGGTGTETFLWSNGATTQNLQNIPAGNYSVTVTSSNGCTASASTTVTGTSQVMATATPTGTTCGQANGNISLNVTGGTGAESFLWSNGATTQNLQNIPAGNYSVTVTSSNGCVATASATVTGTQPPAIALTPIGATCEQVNGTVALGIVGGTGTESFIWSNGATTQNLQNVPAGNYSVTVTGSNGCVATASATVTGTQPPAISLTPIGATCEQANGMVALGIVGGTGTESFLWSNGATTQNLQNVPAGNYSVTVTSSNGCVATASATVTGTMPPAVAATPIGATCEQANGAVALGIVGGTGTETFLWSNGATTQNLQNIPAGNYSVTVTGSNGCTATAAATVTGTIPPEIMATPHVAVSGQSNGSVTLEVTGSVGTPTFLWGNGATTQNLENIPSGIYSVTVTSGNGCTATATVFVDDLTATTLIEEKDYLLTASPNPFGTEVLVNYELATNFKEASLLIVNSLGQQIAEQTITNKKGTVVFGKEMQRSGLYLICLAVDGRTGKALRVVRQ